MTAESLGYVRLYISEVLQIVALKQTKIFLRLIFSARRRLHWNCGTSEKECIFHNAVSTKNLRTLKVELLARI